jgi:hypothetical protein
MATITTTAKPESWKIVSLEELSPVSRRALLGILGLRTVPDCKAGVFSDLCLCEVVSPADCESAIRWCEEFCGTRMPLVFYPGPPVRVFFTARDLGPLAAWYFRAIERVHG